MPTKFGKFISGRSFSWIFLALYILFMCFAAYETDMALCTLAGHTHLYGISYVLFAVLAVLCVAKRDICTKWPNKILQKFLSFLSCLLIYYLMLLPIWVLLCPIFRVSGIGKAIGILVISAAAILIVFFGYLRTKLIKVRQYTLSVGDGTKEYRIALLSDIHLGYFVGEKHVEKFVSKVNQLTSDIIVISGDIFINPCCVMRLN